MKRIIFFGAIAVVFALALGEVFATKPGDEVQSNRLALAGDAAPIDQKIMDTDIKRSGMNEMNKFLSMSMMRKEEPCKDLIATKQCKKKMKRKGNCDSKKAKKYCKKTCDLCDLIWPVDDGQGNEDFQMFDEDSDGLISPSEWIEKFTSAMDSVGITSMDGREMNEGTYREMFNAIDCDKDGYISPTEFKMLNNGQFCDQGSERGWTWCIFGCCKPWWWWLWKVGGAIIKTIRNC